MSFLSFSNELLQDMQIIFQKSVDKFEVANNTYVQFWFVVHFPL